MVGPATLVYASNMRSEHGSADPQERLPLELGSPTAVGERTVRSRRRVPRAAESGLLRYRLPDDALASRGWPAGTELLVAPGRRPRRGQVALVREGGRLKVGVFEVQLGRAALRSDRGSVWIGASAEYVGVVTLAGAPLAGMPDPS
jgi:hypothetical protein